MSDYVTKATARASIREARQALWDLETALSQDGEMREYVLEDDEVSARLLGAFYDVREALQR